MNIIFLPFLLKPITYVFKKVIKIKIIKDPNLHKHKIQSSSCGHSENIPKLKPLIHYIE